MREKGERESVRPTWREKREVEAFDPKAIGIWFTDYPIFKVFNSIVGRKKFPLKNIIIDFTPWGTELQFPADKRKKKVHSHDRKIKI